MTQEEKDTLLARYEAADREEKRLAANGDYHGAKAMRMLAHGIYLELSEKL